MKTKHNRPKCGNSRHPEEEFCTICAAEVANRTPVVATPVRHSRFHNKPPHPPTGQPEQQITPQRPSGKWRNN